MTGPFEESELTGAILARTSGSPCKRLHAQACDYVDGALDEDQGGLLRAHMEHCPACAALVAALGEASALLPSLAQADPGPWFTQRVLRATVRAPRDDARAVWWKLMHRPRICLEAAYLGAAGGLMGLYLPLPGLHKVPVIVESVSVAPLQRAAAGLVRAELRTAASLRRSVPFPEMGRRLKARVQSWAHALKEEASFLGRGKEKPSEPANP